MMMSSTPGSLLNAVFCSKKKYKGKNKKREMRNKKRNTSKSKRKENELRDEKKTQKLI
jgi:hypothetical protein